MAHVAEGDAVKIALGIPHTPWVPERMKSMARLRASLARPSLRVERSADGLDEAPVLVPSNVGYREFTERESNKVWPRKMWTWGSETLKEPTDLFVTIQDDTLIAPCFWPALKAMVQHLPPLAVLGLSATHPLGPEVARQGHRWYRTRSWVIGWGYGMRRADLAEFIAWIDARPELVAQCNEDELVNRWVSATGRFTWHPVPTIVDHDTSIDSQYKNDHHAHRRSTVTWRDFGEGSLTDPDFWLPSGDPQLLALPSPTHCWYCMERLAFMMSQRTGAALCRHCLIDGTAAMLRDASQLPGGK